MSSIVEFMRSNKEADGCFKFSIPIGENSRESDGKWKTCKFIFPGYFTCSNCQFTRSIMLFTF